MACLSLALPAFARCERPTNASVSVWRLQPGRFAQGPDEKCGLTGRMPGVTLLIFIHPYRWALFVGEECPAAAHRRIAVSRQARCSKMRTEFPAFRRCY